MTNCLRKLLLLPSQFITDKFLYDQSAAMESLLKCGLKEQLFELAKVHVALQQFSFVVKDLQ